MRKLLVGLTLAVGASNIPLSAGAAASKGTLFHDGDVVRTVVPPAAIPHGGVDPIYSFTNGADGQLSVAGVAPGDGPYHGGRWGRVPRDVQRGSDPVSAHIR